ncbi:MAG: tetratricopeptide repeat protein [Pedobacter sp.]|nr:MAG: tetratricopeptide repeat protein [Pedobacter sp.]
MGKIILTISLLVATVLTASAQDAFLNKGNSYLNNEQYDKAEQTFRDAIKSDTTNLIYQCQLGLALIQAKKYDTGEQILGKVITKDPSNVAAIWYSGIGNFYNAQDKRAINRFEKALTLLDKKSGQYYSANWFIGKCYSNLLKTDGLTYTETDRMFECYEEYLRLQPNAEDAAKIKEYVERKKKRRPPSNVKVWIDL